MEVNKGSIKLILIIILFTILMPQPSSSNCSYHSYHYKNCCNKEFKFLIHKLWNQVYPTFSHWAEGKGYVSDGFHRPHPYELYDLQLYTSGLLKYISHCKDKKLFESLLNIYLKTFKTLKSSKVYHFFYYPSVPRDSVHPLSHSYMMWLDNNGIEYILYSSQFLFAVSESLVIITEIPPEQRSLKMKKFSELARKILLSHYSRWIFSQIGPFQVRGWGCTYAGKYVEIGLNHYEFLKKKLQYKLGDKDSPSYCNAVTDTDMWIIAGVANLLTAHQLNPKLIPLTDKEVKKYMNYLKLGLSLLKSRIKFIKIKDFSGHLVEGMLFDPGAWDDYYEYRCMNYKGETYPNNCREIPPPSNVAWDISHGRRFVTIFSALACDAKVLSLSFPCERILKAMANEFVYKVFNGNWLHPIFSNFLDGRDGWYRVGYSSRKGFGYAPGDLSIAALTGGYATLALYNYDLAKLYKRLSVMVLCGSTLDKDWLKKHFAGNRYLNYRRISLPLFKNKMTPEMERFLLMFVPSLYDVDIPSNCLKRCIGKLKN